MPRRMFDWLKKTTFAIVDPERHQRIEALAKQVEQIAAGDRKAFNFDEALVKVDAAKNEDREIAELIYHRALRRVWKDEQLSDSERAGLDWLAGRLKIGVDHRAKINQEYALAIFEAALAEVLMDGRISSIEARRLELIAAGMGTTVSRLVRDHFSQKGEAFLRNMFAAIVAGGVLNEEAWAHLMNSAALLGVRPEELQVAISQQAKTFVEHTLADAKADGRLSSTENASLMWLLDRLRLPAPFVAYVRTEIEELRADTDIREGRLPVTDAKGVLLNAGEIAHYQDDCVFNRTRQLKNGTKVEDFRGHATITDTRLIFSSPTHNIDLPHRRVLSMRSAPELFEIGAEGRGAGIYSFLGNHRLGAEIYKAAIQRAKQTLVDRSQGLPSRHISREVRQRVWQKYSGRCADCGATDYLEFDHVIPVARGGSNAEMNVQLLCRRCNLKKSDSI